VEFRRARFAVALAAGLERWARCDPVLGLYVPDTTPLYLPRPAALQLRAVLDAQLTAVGWVHDPEPTQRTGPLLWR
jgi:hypothetical protein